MYQQLKMFLTKQRTTITYVYMAMIALVVSIGVVYTYSRSNPTFCDMYAKAVHADAICPVGSLNVYSGTLGLQGGTSFTVTWSGTPTAARMQTVQDLSGVLALGTGGNSIFFTTTAATAVQLPTTGTLASLAGSETLTNKSLTSPTITGTLTASSATVNFTSTTISGGTYNGGAVWNGNPISLTAYTTGVLPVANGGTNASTASITSFNNITGYTAAGATGTTSSNLVFSASPTITGTLTLTGATITGGTYTSTTLSSPSISNPVFSGTTTGTYALGGTPTITGPTITSFALFTAASPIHYQNGQTVSLINSVQTVGDANLTIPDLAGVNDTYALLTKAQTLSSKTLSTTTFVGNVTGGTFTSTTLSSPTVTGGGSLAGTFTGTYTLAGTPTITSPALNGTVTTTGLTMPAFSVNSTLTVSPGGSRGITTGSTGDYGIFSTATSGGTSFYFKGAQSPVGFFEKTGADGELFELVGNTVNYGFIGSASSSILSIHTNSTYDLYLELGGNLRFGVYTASSTPSSTGYVTFKTADGITHKLLVN